MSYSKDIRMLVIKHIAGGGSKSDASRKFGLSRTTIYKFLREGITPAPLPLRRNRKVNSDLLKDLIFRHPDMTLRELSESIGVHYSTIHYALKRLNMSRKKNVVVS
jgi:putative transposase